MNKFIKHIPGFMISHPDDLIPQTFEFSTLEEFLEHPWIKREWEEDFQGLFQFNKTIIAQFVTSYWVLGFVEHPISLPIWKCPNYEADK